MDAYRSLILVNQPEAKEIYKRPGENRELLTDVQDLEQNQSDFRYEVTMVRISAIGWASSLRDLPEMNFSQLYDYPVVSREYRHIVLRGTHYRKYH